VPILCRWPRTFSLGRAGCTSLAWLDPPPAASLAQARDLLMELDALDEQGRITTAGRAMAQLPLHPRLAHMLRAARSCSAVR